MSNGIHVSGTVFGKIRMGQKVSPRIYRQVRDWLARLILEPRFSVHDALPPERVLAENLGVSRGTTRRAMEALVDDGLIVRRHGSGNFVTPLLAQRLNRLTGFTEELRERGFVPGSRWIRRCIGGSITDEMVALGLSPAAPVSRLERVRLAGVIPIAYEVATLPISIVSAPEEITDSLYTYLAERSLMPVRALQHVRVANATERQANLLCISTGQALLFITRVGYLKDNRAAEFTRTWCRSDYYDFVAELTHWPS